MGDKKRSSDYLGISEKRIEELKRITTYIMMFISNGYQLPLPEGKGL